jgi:cell division protein FtsW (lipid II flippase)
VFFREGLSAVSATPFEWLSVLAIVAFWGWVLLRGLKTTNRRNKRVFVGCALLVFLVMLWNVYVGLTSSN